ncbi:MAG: sugar-binding protein [Sphaerochaetaceae bacterium]|jgi:putative multiple sugar transport system substrate-binding protein|nr:sugar ABC transporter substrate-binding protein [Sphaerochaetaceae bacterium]MDX9809343.1 sugar ABC transporter substrate-binding protein [Sphaerochaetaceae bacterium]NLV83827.1 sugar ABC transporter substrate-binding protein [Spirochaetales bacterium]
MKKLVILLLLVVLMVPLFAGAQQEQATKKPMVTFLMPTKEQPIWLFQGDELVKLFKEKGFETRLEYAEDIIERQVYQIENAVTLGTKYLVIAAVDSYSISDAVEKAKAAGVVVIANDRLIMNTKAVDYYVTFDLYRLGQMQGEYIERALGLDAGKKGPFNMEIVSGSPDDPNSQIFYNGAMSVLKKYLDAGSLVVRSGQLEFGVTATLAWDTAKAMARMDNLLSAYYTNDIVHAVLGAADCVSLGVISALTSMGYGTAGRPFPVVTGQDCELTAIKSIIEGKQTMSVFLDAKVLAEKTFEIIDAFEKGVALKPDKMYFNDVFDVPAVMYEPVAVDKDNWQIVIDRGLYTEADLK